MVFQLRDILYNRTLADNIISVSQLTDAGFRMKFTKYCCQIMDGNDIKCQRIVAPGNTGNTNLFVTQEKLNIQ